MANPGENILMPRNVHISVIKICAMQNINPIFFDLEYSTETGHYKPITKIWLENVFKKLNFDENKIAGVILVNPSYQGYAGTQKYIQNIPIKTVCGENDRILGKKELKKIGNIEKLNFVGLQNCGHLPHIDLPSLSSKIIQDYFLE